MKYIFRAESDLMRVFLIAFFLLLSNSVIADGSTPNTANLMHLSAETEQQISQTIPNWKDIVNSKKFGSWKALQPTPINDLFYSKDAAKLIRIISLYLEKNTSDSATSKAIPQNQTLKDRDDSIQMMKAKPAETHVEQTLPTPSNDCSSLDSFLARFRCNLKANNDSQEEVKMESLRRKCDGMGYQRGTNEFSQCMMSLVQMDNANAQAAAQRLQEQSMPRPMVNLTPQVVPGNNSLTCVPSRSGVGFGNQPVVINCQ